MNNITIEYAPRGQPRHKFEFNVLSGATVRQIVETVSFCGPMCDVASLMHLFVFWQCCRRFGVVEDWNYGL
jgi:hypothetical protein